MKKNPVIFFSFLAFLFSAGYSGKFNDDNEKKPMADFLIITVSVVAVYRYGVIKILV
jgi:hypothetical protein